MPKILKSHWLKCPKTVPKKRILDQKMKYLKIKFGDCFLISDFLAGSIKASKN